MASILTRLPPDLLGDILSHEEVTHCALKLFLTGDRDMKSKLVRGVRIVELKRGNEWYRSRPPKFLTELRSLRVLRIDRSGRYLCEPKEAVDVVRNLSPTLVELHLVFERATRIFEIENDSHALLPSLFDLDLSEDTQSQHQSSHPGIWDIGQAFPKLKLLHIGGRIPFAPQDLRLLPPSLTDLRVPLPRNYHDYSEYMEAIPLNVTTLAQLLPLSKSVFIATLPSHITALDVEYFLDYGSRITLNDLKKLPSTLTSIKGFREILFSLDFASALPRQLVDFGFNSWRVNLGEHFSTDAIVEILDALPPNLTQLNVHATPLFDSDCIRRLPRSLKRLSCNVTWDNVRKEDWPETLTSLSVKNAFNGASMTWASSASPPSVSALATSPPSLSALATTLTSLSALATSPPSLSALATSPPSLSALATTLTSSSASPSTGWSLSTTSARAPSSKAQHFGELLPDKLETFLADKVILALDDLALLPRSLTQLNVSLIPPATFRSFNLAHVSFPPHLSEVQLGTSNWNFPAFQDNPSSSIPTSSIPTSSSVPVSSSDSDSSKFFNLLLNLPASVTQLVLTGGYLPLESLFVLPPLLSGLTLPLSVGTPFDTQNVAYKQRMEALVRLGVQSGCGEEADILAASSRSLTLPLDLIPRTVSTLHLLFLGEPKAAGAIGWNRLPRHALRSLTIPSFTLPADDFFQDGALHLKRLHTLSMDASGVRDEHLAALPPLSGFFQIHSLSRNSLITPACIPFVPPGIDPFLFIHHPIRNEYATLHSKRRSAFSSRNWPLFDQLCATPFLPTSFAKEASSTSSES